MYFGFKNLKISFDKNDVVNDITMDFEKGNVITILGPNGCGKSSILRTLSKAVKPKAGESVYLDKAIKTYKKKEIAKKIGILPQIHSTPPDIDVETLVSYGRYPYTNFSNLLKESDWEIVREVMKSTGISKLAKRRVSALSGGERQRVWIAMILCQQPEILVLDEPTTFLDINHQVEVLELVKELNTKHNITIVMVLHDINLAIRYSDYIYTIKNGKIYSEGKPNEVITEEFLRDVFSIEANMYVDEINNCSYIIPQKPIKKE